MVKKTVFAKGLSSVRIWRKVTCKSNKIDTLNMHGLGDGFSL